MMQDYRQFAHEIERDIRAGTLLPGEKLLPQREFAWRRGIAVSTASRAYAELRRRGLVCGEVGRGTYVRRPEEPMANPAAGFVDLDRNYSMLPDQAGLMSQALSGLTGPAELQRSVGAPEAADLEHARQVAARYVSRGQWRPSAEDIHFTGNECDALASALALLARPGDRIGVETFTCRIMKGICANAGVELIPLRMDEHGVVPSAIADVHRRIGLSCVYLQPTLHNPLGITLKADRRREIAEVLDAEDLFAIEETLNGFLADEVPLAAWAPERVLVVDGFADRIAPGLQVGVLVVPQRMRALTPAAVRRMCWGAPGLGLSATIRLIESGALASLEHAKRVDAASRQALARDALRGLEIVCDERAYHLWLRLPEGWRAEAFVAAAAILGIAVTSGEQFAVNPGHSPNAVRLMLGTPSMAQLKDALERLRQLALSTVPESAGANGVVGPTSD